MKPGFYASLLGGRIIFGKKTHQRDAGPKSRSSLLWWSRFLLPAFLFGFIFVQCSQRKAAAPKSRISQQWGSRFYFPRFQRDFVFFQSTRQRDAGPKTRTSLCEVRFFVAGVYGFVPIDTTAGVVPVPQSIAPCGQWFPRRSLRRGGCWLPKEKSSRAFLQAGLLFG